MAFINMIQGITKTQFNSVEKLMNTHSDLRIGLLFSLYIDESFLDVDSCKEGRNTQARVEGVRYRNSSISKSPMYFSSNSALFETQSLSIYTEYDEAIYKERERRSRCCRHC